MGFLVPGSTGLKPRSNLPGEDSGGHLLMISFASVSQSDVTNGSKSCSSCDVANWAGTEMSIKLIDRMKSSNSVFELKECGTYWYENLSYE